MLYIVASYHFMQFQGKLMNQTWENGKIPSFEPNFGLFWPKFRPQNFCSWFLPLLDLRNCCKLSLYMIFQGKLMNETWENSKKPSFRPGFRSFVLNLPPPPPQFFSWVLPLLNVRHYCKLSFYAISRKTNEPNLRKWQQT